MQTFQGLAVSDGLTVGPVVRIDRGAAGLHRIVCDPFRERALYAARLRAGCRYFNVPDCPVGG